MRKNRNIYIKKGSYEIDKNREKNSRLLFSSKNIEGVKEYRDKANQVVYVWIKYDNPHTNDITTDIYAIRKKMKMEIIK
ncbi:hypothetical protein GCM10020331_011900 [Ectobacillus funiculus]